MTQLSPDELESIYSAEKFVDRSLRYQRKSGGSHMEAKAAIRCPKLPELNLSFISIFHITRDPRRFNLMLLHNKQRILALDVNPAGIHTNPITLEKVNTTHWHSWPNDVAKPDIRKMNHMGWSHEFSKRCNINFVKGYIAPAFEEESEQYSLLLGSNT